MTYTPGSLDKEKRQKYQPAGFALLGDIGYRWLRLFGRTLGLEITVVRSGNNLSEYGPIFVRSRYRPWVTDETFGLLYPSIKQYTMIREEKLYGLWQLAGEAMKMEGAAIEVGCWRGGSGAVIAKRCVGTMVYLCDTFAGVVKAGENDPHYTDGDHNDCCQADVHIALKNAGVGENNVRILSGIFPEETASSIPENTVFKFCHIDVDTYQSAADAVRWVLPRMVPGGIMVFDDYGNEGTSGVREFVDDLAIQPKLTMIYNLNGHAVVIKNRD